MRLCCTIVAGICAGAEQNEERFDFYFSTFKGIVVEIAMKSQEDVVLFCFLFICRDSLSFFSGGCYSLLFLSRSFAFCVENVFCFFCSFVEILCLLSAGNGKEGALESFVTSLHRRQSRQIFAVFLGHDSSPT